MHRTVIHRTVRALRVAIVIASAGLLVVPAAAAARHSPAPAALTLQAETWSYSSNPSAPGWCLNEDDYHYRNWAGGLNGQFSTAETLCAYAADGWSAGGIGLQAEVWVTGTLNDLSIVSPSGSTQAAVLMGQTKLKGGAIQSHYAVCVMPPFYLSTNTGTNPLAGGNWTITLSGQATTVNYEVRAMMGYPDQQLAYCPPSEQNLLP